MPDMSDADFFAAGTPKPSSISDADFMNMGAKAQSTPYQTDPTRAAYQATMNNVAKPINTAVSDLVGAATSVIPQSIKDRFSKFGNYLANEDAITSPVYTAAKEGATELGENVKDLESYNKDLAHDLPAFGQNAQLAGNLVAVKPLIEAGSAMANGTSPLDFLKNQASGNPDALPTTKPVPSVYDPVATHSAISDAYGAAKANARPYYNLMNEIGAGETADASELKPALDSMISDIQNTPFHEATSELPYLKQQAAKISDDGMMPLNDMVKLKQNLNSNFNPKRFAQGADSPYGVVGGIVDNSLEDAANRIPEFGEAKSLADKNWLNSVKAPFEDNTVLKKFWQPEDYYAKRSVDNGMLEELPDPTLERANAMLSKVKTPTQLNAIRRALPEDLADTFSQAKIQDLQAGKGKLADIGKAAYNAGNMQFSSAAKNIKDVFSSSYTPTEQALLDAAKTPSPTLSVKYQKPYQDLKTSLQQQKDLAGEMQPFGVGQPLPVESPALQGTASAYINPEAKILPKFAPSSNAPSLMGKESVPTVAAQGTASAYFSPAAKALSKFTPNEQAAALMERISGETPSGGASAYISPEARDISKSISPKEAKDILEKLSTSENSKPQGTASTYFAKGGKVNTNPSEAQKQAGNYAKEHITLHGLDIAIENPKGSIRSGEHNGKKWCVKMPAAYGYIKGTEGADRDHVDCYIGPRPKSEKIWIIDQKDADTGRFDEHKCFIGFPNKALVLATYRKAFSDGKADKRIHAITEVTLDELKNWLKTTMRKVA